MSFDPSAPLPGTFLADVMNAAIPPLDVVASELCPTDKCFLLDREAIGLDVPGEAPRLLVVPTEELAEQIRAALA